MGKILFLTIAFFVTGLLVVAAGVSTQSHRQIPVIIDGKVKPRILERGESIPLTITVSNGLPSSIYHTTFSVGPNEWNGETVNISLVAIYRDKPFDLYLAKPNGNRSRAGGIFQGKLTWT